MLQVKEARDYEVRQLCDMKTSVNTETDSHCQTAIQSEFRVIKSTLQTSADSSDDSQDRSENTGENEKSRVSLSFLDGGGGIEQPPETQGFQEF